VGIHWLAASVVFLSGCNDEFFNKTLTDIYAQATMTGLYKNGGAYLVLDGKSGTFVDKGMKTTKKYDVYGDKLFMHMPNGDSERREDLELLIKNNGNQLLCSSCGIFGLNVTWERIETSPNHNVLEKKYE
jgi:hypothetical protein